MSKKILIDTSSNEETRVAITENGKLDDFEIESKKKNALKGDIYLAKITRIEPSLQAAFVDYGANRHGFLPLTEIHPDYFKIPATDQENLRSFGHSIECRINAEDPNTFIPCPGKITNFYAPSGPGVRIDSNCYSGLEISPYYDSLIAKLIIHDKNREACIKRLKRALSEFVIDGIKTTIPFFQEIINQEKFLNGDYNINWLEEYKSKKV